MKVSGTGFKNFSYIDLEQRNGAAFIDIKDKGKLSLTFGDGTENEFDARYIQFKSPSDHCFDQKRLDVEMQIYLAKPGEEHVSAAIALFWDRSANTEQADECKFIESIRPNMAFMKRDFTLVVNSDGQKIPARSTIYDIKLKSILGAFDFRSFYSYEGSLTSPPCSEGVQWTVVRAPRPISDKQVEAFRSEINNDPRFGKSSDGLISGSNARSLQALNGRSVYLKAEAVINAVFSAAGFLLLLQHF